MRRNVCLKSALRQPAHTLFLVLLVGLISFVFVSRMVEYLVVNRETDRLERYYRSIGSLQKVNPENPDDWDISQGVELVSRSQYVDFEDLRRCCSGVLQGVHNSDVDGSVTAEFGTLTSDVLFYGSLRSKARLPKRTNGLEEYRFIFDVDKVMAGYPEYVREGSEARLEYLPEYVADARVLQGVRYVPGNPDELDTVYDSFEVGARYLMRARFEPLTQMFYRREMDDDSAEILMIRPLSQSGVWFWDIEPGRSADLADPGLAGLAEEMAVMRENQHAMYVTSTSDMSSMPQTQEASRFLYLTKGRWLDSDDSSESRRVCVVHNDFAVRRGLSVGDSITLQLRDLKNPFDGYIIPGEDWDAWQGYETYTEEFEIVGLYGILINSWQPTTYSSRMYIPDSCMPAGYGSRDGIWETTYSFVLSSPEHEKAFLAENRQALEELGTQVSFVESGWENFQAATVPMKQSLAINVRIFSAVLVSAMALAAFLYLWQRRRDFAILRSVGVPKGEAIRQLLWSMAAIGTTSVATGGLLSWGYSLRKAANTLASLQGPKGAGPSTDLSLVWLAGLCAVAIVVLLSITVAGASVMSLRPVLGLLQGTESRAIRKRRPVVRTEGEGERGGERPEKAPSPSPDTVQIVPEGGTARSLGRAPATRERGHALSSTYVLRHIRRAPLKSILTVSVALGFTLALGWLSWSVDRNDAELDELYRATQVEARIVKTNPSVSTAGSGGGFIPSEKVDAILETGFIKDAYFVAASRASSVGAFLDAEEPKRDYSRTAASVPLLGFSQPERFFFEMGKYAPIEYVEGWDESLFSKDWNLDEPGGRLPVMLPTAMMSQLRLRLGDSVWLQDSASYASVDCRVVGQYAGMITLGDYEPSILLPLSVLKILEKGDLHYAVAEFTIDSERNRQLPEFRARMDDLFGENGKSGAAGLTLIFWDNQMTQVVEPMEKNLLLVRILHSVTIAVSTLIAAGLGALMVFQSAKEAAIMRVLGATKRLARSMLCGEQALLCVLGLVLGLGTFAVVRGQVSAAFSGSALGCAALYLAGCLIGAWQGARSVTDRPLLELLQVKE